MKPSEKSDEMESALTGLFGFDRRAGIEAGVCSPPPIGCGGPAVKFKDELSRKEYTISGLCQKCQDGIFDDAPDDEEGWARGAATTPAPPRPPLYVAGPDEFVTEGYQMFCGSADAEERVYRKHITKSGCVWLVAVQEAAAENIYFHDPRDTKSQGFAGRTLEFKLEDGSIYKAKGPWHSSADGLFRDTGIDLRNTVRTFVALAKERDCTKDGSYRTILRGIVYRDEAPMLGNFYRYKELIRMHPEARFYYSQSKGSSSCGPCASEIASK